MSCPVFMAGTDNPGLQPSCSIIITSTRAGGLGCLIVRRWRGGNMPSVGTAKESTPVRMGVPPFASISVHSRFSPSPSGVDIPTWRSGRREVLVLFLRWDMNVLEMAIV